MKLEIKKYVAVGLVILSVTACLAGCAVAAAPADPTEPATQATKPGEQGPSIDKPLIPGILGTAELKQIRLAGYDANWVSNFQSTFGSCVIVSNYESLVNAFENIDALGRNVNFPSNYDHDFFTENRLVLIPWTSGSGSIQFVADAYHDDGTVKVIVEGRMPGDIGTTDMADWLLMIVLPRDKFREEIPVEVQLPQQGGPGVGFKDGLEIMDR